MPDIIPKVSIEKGRPIVSSLSIAEHFGKQHKDVLRKIEHLEIPEEFNERNFAPVDYKDAKGESRPAYNLTRDGFHILVMGFTGKAAMQWKIRYIEAFNAMENMLSEPQQLPATTPSRDKFKELYQLLTEWSTQLRDKEVWDPHNSLQNAIACMMISIGKDERHPVLELTTDEIFHGCEYLRMQITTISGAPAQPVQSAVELEKARIRSEKARKSARARWDKQKALKK
ncbi:Rha family transcriptional regulator [Maridesulfovibrio sp.]|uniref:Rha family transcriptional regulator n=1 Tax=Maridesulfovibrio sp. TaxID=2795000 RepID=UPI0029F5C741|nr:Rha family transcriptional regulator [Maridesulfovibrio sp.]